MASDDFVVDLDALNAAFRDFVPHNKALGLTLIEATTEPAVAVMRLPYDLKLVGNPETGVLHGGAITTAMDATCGAAVFLKLRAPVPIATLDLRLDYLQQAEPGRDVICRAECFKKTRNVAFVRAHAFHAQGEEPIATATGTFMISTPGKAVNDPSVTGKPGW